MFLQEIDLSSNHFNSKGVFKLINCLSNDYYLKALSLHKNSNIIDSDTQQHIMELFKYNESLLIFDLRDIPECDEEFLKNLLLMNVRNIKMT